MFCFYCYKFKQVIGHSIEDFHRNCFSIPVYTKALP
ncbi:hypothetical protein TcasGA2_TC032958 [Tribolium castaneum]|uniref:Uncharacterized protein n=1 Tax=Tribolium castaneum TaxID=7070 RepID=A0A139WIC0_TRICA|nr:hypothetical protein TcasGA2_TC032958 [Tribolium castaneum]